VADAVIGAAIRIIGCSPIVGVRGGFAEAELRDQVKQAGGK